MSISLKLIHDFQASFYAKQVTTCLGQEGSGKRKNEKEKQGREVDREYWEFSDTKKPVKNSVKRKIFSSQVHSCFNNHVKRNADSKRRGMGWVYRG
ncbi:hypothetical protein KQX54_016370 [Cotesia glomerata]|uniref:Uncharacterized protein n=1 Tax=Cotesia glomerata TaxID=32391 RepID=A0AAV7I7Y1_COTGL|nr:hypothetical protein KQX54_016370 [Cotesia glomerata]